MPDNGGGVIVISGVSVKGLFTIVCYCFLDRKLELVCRLLKFSVTSGVSVNLIAFVFIEEVLELTCSMNRLQ